MERYWRTRLKSSGKELYFWRSGNTAEIDFIYEEEGEIIPVEVKAADNTQAKSYKQFCKKYGVMRGFKLSQKNIAEGMCENTKTFSIPLYLGWNVDAFHWDINKLARQQEYRQLCTELEPIIEWTYITAIEEVNETFSGEKMVKSLDNYFILGKDART